MTNADYFYVKPSGLVTNVETLGDLIPGITDGDWTSAKTVNRNVRFGLILAIVLALIFQSFWPIIIGGGLLLLIIVLSAGIEYFSSSNETCTFDNEPIKTESPLKPMTETKVLSDSIVRSTNNMEMEMDDNHLSAPAVDQLPIVEKRMDSPTLEEILTRTEPKTLLASLIPNPSAHNNYYQMDPRYLPTPDFKYKRAVVDCDKVVHDEQNVEPAFLENLQNQPHVHPQVNENNVPVDPMRQVFNQNPNQNIESLYSKNQNSGGLYKLPTDHVVLDPTEKMVHDMFQNANSNFMAAHASERIPPKHIFPNSREARAREEAAARSRNEWHGFSMNLGA